MEEARIGQALLTDPADVIYYGGYAPQKDEHAFMAVTQDRACLFVSPLNSDAAGAGGVETRFLGKNALPVLSKKLKTGFDEVFASARLYLALKNAGVKVEPFAVKIKEPRIVKGPEEIEAIRKSVSVTRKIIGALSPCDRTEKEVANEIKLRLLAAGAGESYDSIVATGKNSAVVHAVPGNAKILPGALTIIDMGARANFYCSDMTRTFCPKAGQREKRIIEDVKEIQSVLIDSARVGVKTDELEKTYEGLMKKKHYRVMHSFGHGIGLSVHEPLGEALAAGAVMTIEPGAYLRGLGGCRIEDIILVKGGKVSVL